jgi:hypothetical protein
LTINLKELQVTFKSDNKNYKKEPLKEALGEVVLVWKKEVIDKNKLNRILITCSSFTR